MIATAAPRDVLAAAREPLNPLTLAKYVDPLPVPAVEAPGSTGVYTLTMSQFAQRLHSQLPPTVVWGYNGS